MVDVHNGYAKNGFNLLLVDDELHFCRLVTDILALSDCTLSYYTDPHEGLREAITQRALDLIILDIEMPDISGLDILRQIKKSHNRRVPVMMFTAHAEISVVRQALELGAQEYLLKPFSVHEFVSRVQYLLHAPIFPSAPTLLPGASHSNNPVSRAEKAVPLAEAPLILMVDDDVFAIQLIQDMLAGSACRLLSTTHPQEGLEIVVQQEPALILLDVHMPQLSGLEFLKTLRETLKKQTPVIILSVDTSENTMRELSVYQPYAYLGKPYRFHQLISQIESILQITLFPGRL